jgi:hypothetical protein
VGIASDTSVFARIPAISMLILSMSIMVVVVEMVIFSSVIFSIVIWHVPDFDMHGTAGFW